jgi:peptide/nickel transport system permease protein
MWKKLSKNKLGVFGLAFILFTVVLAILGYAITPDSTTDANTIQLQVALQKPGFKTRYFSQEKEQSTTNFFTESTNGRTKGK